MVADARGTRAPPLGGPWVKMSASASVGGPVPPPPPGPAASLPPGSAARALHVELPSQQVTPWARGAPRRVGGTGGGRGGEPVGGGRTRCQPGDLEKCPGRTQGTEDLRIVKGGSQRWPKLWEIPESPERSRYWSPAAKRLEETQWNSPGAPA